MDTVASHPHSFTPDAWPFQEPINAVAYTTESVLSGSKHVLVVFHDHDGDWQFLHGETPEADECKIICLGCAYERDTSVGVLARLPVGWKATRDSVSSEWRLEPYADGDEEEG